MIEVVPIEPPTLLVKVLLSFVKLLFVFKLVIVAFVAFKLSVLVVEAVMLVAKRLVMYPVRELITSE